MKKYIKCNYYRVAMIHWDENDESHRYNAYTTGFNRYEASMNVYDELLSYEQDDQVDYATEISEDEYKRCYARFGDGFRD